MIEQFIGLMWTNDPDVNPNVVDYTLLLFKHLEATKYCNLYEALLPGF